MHCGNRHKEVEGINSKEILRILEKHENAVMIAAREIHALRRIGRIKTGVIAVLSAVCAALVLYIAACA